MEEKVFVDVETLSVGFSEYKLPQAVELVGRKVELNYEGGYTVTYEFLDNETIKVKYQKDNEIEVIGSIYSAVAVRKDVYFVDFVWSFGETKSVSTVIDFSKNIATTCLGYMPTLEEAKISLYERFLKKAPLTSVKTVWDHAAVDGPFTKDTKKHQKTSQLVGERLQFKYSENDAYEHIYLNENYYTWHCLTGVEKGLCDTDLCQFYELGDNLIWFVWQEKIVPTLGCVIEDLNVMRSYGKLYGYKNSIEEQTVINFQAGSYAKILNKTEYDL